MSRNDSRCKGDRTLPYVIEILPDLPPIQVYLDSEIGRDIARSYGESDGVIDSLWNFLNVSMQVSPRIRGYPTHITGNIMHVVY